MPWTVAATILACSNGFVPLGYDAADRTLIISAPAAAPVRTEAS